MYFLNFNTNPTKCCICYSIDGKNEKEKIFEITYNQKYMNYPLLSLSNAYNCNCHHIFAHNKCLLHINKCPSCQKPIKFPNLYVKTQYDYYLYYLFEWIKNDITRINSLRIYVLFCVIFIIYILYLFSKYKDTIDYYISIKTKIALLFAITIGFFNFISLYIVILDDYFLKYWLYDTKLKKCHVFNGKKQK